MCTCTRILHGSCFAGSVVPEEGCDLSLVEVESQSVHRTLVSFLIDLLHTADRYAKGKVIRLSLIAIRFCPDTTRVTSQLSIIN